MSAFTARPPITAHVRSTRYVPRCAERGLVNLCCAVCGVIGTVSPFHPTDDPAAALMAAHVTLVTSLAHLPDAPNVCLACKPPSGRSDHEPWALCPRHTRINRINRIRNGWKSGDVERLLRAWDALETEYAPDGTEIAAEEFGDDWPALDAALDQARRDLPAVRHWRALWEATRARRAADRSRWRGMSWRTGYSDDSDDTEND